MNRHRERMARIYGTGSFARVVAAGGAAGFMNLGHAPDPLRPGSTAERQRAMARLILRAVAPRPGQAVLDVGCGRGGLINVIAARVPDAAAVGLNIDPHQLAPARQGPAAFVSGAAEALPFADGAFDTVVAVELLSHVPDKKALAGEFARILRPGGRVVVAYIALTRPYSGFAADHRAHLRRVAELFAEHPRDIPTRAAALELFENAGLRTVQTTDLSDGVFPPRHEEFVALLRRLQHAVPAIRRSSVALAALRWKVRPAELVNFLRVNVAAHPSRFYEYHLTIFTTGRGGG